MCVRILALTAANVATLGSTATAFAPPGSRHGDVILQSS
jgi:hypothetical protein